MSLNASILMLAASVFWGPVAPGPHPVGMRLVRVDSEEENAFLPCSFWLVEALASAGRMAEATALMDELVGLTTDVGLLAEEMDPADHSMRGNLPLCLSHLALLNAAAVHTAAAASAPKRRALTDAGAGGRTS